MATYNPTTTSYPSGVVTISNVDTAVPYSEVQQSMGANNYEILSVYIKTNNITQLLQPITFQKYDSNGNIVSDKYVPTVDPYSTQPSIKLDVQGLGYVLDGKLKIDYNVEPSESVQMFFDTKVLDNSSLMGKNDTFDDEFLKTYDMFQEYADEIPIDFDLYEAKKPELKAEAKSESTKQSPVESNITQNKYTKLPPVNESESVPKCTNKEPSEWDFKNGRPFKN